MKLRISVTKEILEKSKDCFYGVTKNCAIAVAIRDVFDEALVCNKVIYPLRNSLVTIYLPESAQDFILTFDSLKHNPSERVSMRPISFEIDVPDEVINRINIDEVTELLKDHPTMQLV